MDGDRFEGAQWVVGKLCEMLRCEAVPRPLFEHVRAVVAVEVEYGRLRVEHRQRCIDERPGTREGTAPEMTVARIEPDDSTIVERTPDIRQAVTIEVSDGEAVTTGRSTRIDEGDGLPR